MAGRVLRTRTPYLFECGVLCRLFLIGSFHNLLIDKRKSAPHFLCIYTNHLGARCAIVVTMNQKLQDSYEAIIDELNLPEIKSFKIGVTHDLDERKEKYLAEGYSEIYAIATGDNANIIQAESDLIKALKSDDRVCSKCCNSSAALGLGKTEYADTLYVVVRIEFDELISSADIHLENILFANGFPISL